jgi:hypothetical protein
MHQTLQQTLAGLQYGPTIRVGNLSVTALLASAGSEGTPDYLTLDEALAGGQARVTEVSQSGNVPELRFENDGEQPVLLLDGEELVGAKQNRILNLSIFVPAKCALAVPVSCVEAGRWRYESAAFRSEGRAFYAEGRKQKMAQVSRSLREGESRQADQHAVWDSIAMKAARLGTVSETGAMSDVFKGHEERIEACVRAVAPAARQVGAVFRIGGKVCGIELFDYPQTLARLLPKLVRSYALDALDESRRAANEPGKGFAAETAAPETATAPAAEEAAFQAFLAAVLGAQVDVFPALGEGEDLRLSSAAVAGGALAARERVVHLSAFSLDAGEEDPVPRRAARVRSRPV